MNSTSLKPGDTIGIIESTWGRETLRKATVEKLTPTGQVVTDRGRFSAAGYVMGVGGDGFEARIVEFTPEFERRWKVQEAIAGLKATNWAKVPEATLIEVWEMVGGDRHD